MTPERRHELLEMTAEGRAVLDREAEFARATVPGHLWVPIAPGPRGGKKWRSPSGVITRRKPKGAREYGERPTAATADPGPGADAATRARQIYDEAARKAREMGGYGELGEVSGRHRYLQREYHAKAADAGNEMERRNHRFTADYHGIVARAHEAENRIRVHVHAALEHAKGVATNSLQSLGDKYLAGAGLRFQNADKAVRDGDLESHWDHREAAEWLERSASAVSRLVHERPLVSTRTHDHQGEADRLAAGMRDHELREAVTRADREAERAREKIRSGADTHADHEAVARAAALRHAAVREMGERDASDRFIAERPSHITPAAHAKAIADLKAMSESRLLARHGEHHKKALAAESQARYAGGNAKRRSRTREMELHDHLAALALRELQKRPREG